MAPVTLIRAKKKKNTTNSRFTLDMRFDFHDLFDSRPVRSLTLNETPPEIQSLQQFMLCGALLLLL